MNFTAGFFTDLFLAESALENVEGKWMAAVVVICLLLGIIFGLTVYLTRDWTCHCRRPHRYRDVPLISQEEMMEDGTEDDDGTLQ